MYSNHKQMGRSRVNWNYDSKKTKKTHVQMKKRNVTQMDKLYSMQKQFITDGMSTFQYKGYIQEKINNKMFHYRKLSEEDVSNLNKRYRRVIQEKENKVNKLLEHQKRNKRQKKLFKEKKKKVINGQRRAMIQQLFNLMKDPSVQGVNKRANELSDDPDSWTRTKKLLFIGGRYIEKSDNSWVEVYKKIVSPVSAHLFDLHSHDALNEYIMNQ